MKALITAGGRGTRLRPLTHTLNKHLVPICNKPLIIHAIEKVRAAGITDVIININAGDTEIRQVLGTGSDWGITITYIEQDEPRGLGHVLLLAESHIGTEPFIFYYGDNVLAGSLQPYIDEFLKQESDCHLCVVKVTEPSQYGVAVTDGKQVIRTVEKPSEFISDLAITGIQLYRSTIFEAIRHVKPTPPKPPRTIAEMDIPPANQWLIDNGHRVTYSEITGWWKDTGKPEDLLEASRLLLEMIETEAAEDPGKGNELSGKVIIGKQAEVSETRIIGPVIIGDGCKMHQACIGPYVTIGDNSSVEQASVTNSIILGNTSIVASGRTITDSLIGQNVAIIGNGSSDASKMTLLLGDHGKVSL
ncbi:MAG TPA: glucose-1-phosphate thymidylyltransferase [bacterium]|nr:glucose-1-phosphate thymidylyltransferase [bacterium]